MFQLIQPRRAIRAKPGGPAIRYYLHTSKLPNKPARYTISRDIGEGRESWMGREQGWRTPHFDNPRTLLGKTYAQRGHALRTLRKLQEADRAAFSEAGRRRHLESMAPQLLEALEAVLKSAEGVDYGRVVLGIAKRGY